MKLNKMFLKLKFQRTTLCHSIVLPEDLRIRPGGGTGTQHNVLCSGGAGGPEHSSLCCVLAGGRAGTQLIVLCSGGGRAGTQLIVLCSGARRAGTQHNGSAPHPSSLGLHTAPRLHVLSYFRRFLVMCGPKPYTTIAFGGGVRV